MVIKILKTKPEILQRFLIFLGALISLSLVLAYISSKFSNIRGFMSFFGILSIAAGILYICQKILATEKPPGWVFQLFIGAFLLRLVIGVFWVIALPEWGYGSETELAGYVMSDAYDRDIAAWSLADSDEPLLSAFSDYRAVDQYGGLLFFSALIYRLSGVNFHMPLLMVVITSFFSALAVPFGWALAKRLWDEKIARHTAWILMLAPEAILLGSSQMREAFMMSYVAIAGYGMIRYKQDHSILGFALALFILVAGFPLSPIFTAFLLLSLLALFLALHKETILANKTRVFLALVVSIIIFAGAWIFVERLELGQYANPIEIISSWLKQASKWQVYFSERGSGWIDKIFRDTPEWTHSYLLVFYGISRPLLPAAIIASGAAIWKSIAIWRASGWFLMLPFLIYAPIRALSKEGFFSSSMMISAIAWFWIIIASLRGGGDGWDNPRYRVSFIVFQAMLVAWAWEKQKKEPDPWFRRLSVGVIIIIIWFIPWYLRRYTPIDWPVQDVFITLGLGLFSMALYWIVDWVITKE